MLRLKPRVVGIGGVALLVFAMSTLPRDIAQGASGSAPVLVVNTPTQAVPVAVQGNTTIGGTVDANIINTPNVTAFQGGAWSFGLTGSIAAAPAVPPEPFSASTQFTGTSDPLAGPVAAGKRIAITNLTFGNQLEAVILSVGSNDCNGNVTAGGFEVFMAGSGTVTVPFPTPLILAGPCLHVSATVGGPLRLVSAVGYLFTP
jgi:hypothetical protein